MMFRYDSNACLEQATKPVNYSQPIKFIVYKCSSPAILSFFCTNSSASQLAAISLPLRNLASSLTSQLKKSPLSSTICPQLANIVSYDPVLHQADLPSSNGMPSRVDANLELICDLMRPGWYWTTRTPLPSSAISWPKISKTLVTPALLPR